jgi:molybdate transport repressor ModE-like protein
MITVGLRIFQAVARAGSITAGAKAVGVSQSTASSSISALEEHLGTTLFQRTRSGVVRTQAGDVLFTECDKVFLALEQIEREIRDLSDEAVGTFVLGCHDSLGSYFLPGFLESFLPEHPRIEIELWNRSSAEVRQAVLDRHVHFGLVVNAVPHDDLIMRTAFYDAIQIFGPAPLDLADARESLRTSTLVYPNRPPFTTLLDTLHTDGFSFGRLLPTGDLGLARTLARKLGYGLLPRRVALDDGGGGLTELNNALPRFDDQIHLLYRADLPKTQAAVLLRNAVLAHGKVI